MSTFGGEIEIMTTNKDGALTGVPSPILPGIQEHLAGDGDIKYDNTQSTLELGLTPTGDPYSLLDSLKSRVAVIADYLDHEIGLRLLGSSTFPMDPEEYTRHYRLNHVPSPFYEVVRGKVIPQSFPSGDGNISHEIYGQENGGRGWRHETGTNVASIQPWNSLDLDRANYQFAALAMTSWMFNLLGANSPSADGRYRDTRLEQMWGTEGMLSGSIFQQDLALTKLPKDFVSDGQVKGLTDYYGHVWGNTVPMVAPAENEEYKGNPLVLVHKQMQKPMTVLELLQSHEPIPLYDLDTGRVTYERYKPKDILSRGFDFLYFPKAGRIRLNVPNADLIEPQALANAIEDRDEETFKELLRIGGVTEEGFMCIEGRVPATILPSSVNEGWAMTNLPFVLQTGVIRAAESIVSHLTVVRGLNWEELTEEALYKSNRYLNDDNGTQEGVGLNSNIRGIPLKQLALEVLSIIGQENVLTEQEWDLIGGRNDSIIEQILRLSSPPAERNYALGVDDVSKYIERNTYDSNS